jgi:N-methylhydantoinase A/oxoprolinase/acetone carboxylase beta subunit
MESLEFRHSFHMMVSGAVVTTETAKNVPIRLVDSGAAAGAVAASYFARQSGRRRVVSFEMGGTTAKLCYIQDGKPSFTNRFEVARVDVFRPGSGLPIAIPATDVIEIGTGGGSIAWEDDLGLLKVGPRSASSYPGPACYGRGGVSPTVTDANLVLGYLSPQYFLGGDMRLDVEAAERAIDTLAKSLGMGRIETAWGIHKVATESMVNAARQYAAEHGYDPRAATLIAFGGAGPAHAVRFSRQLGCREVIVPRGAGVSSAVGLLSAPVGFDFVRTYIVPLDAVDLDALNDMLQEMEQLGRAMLKDAGVPDSSIVTSRFCEMRYVGQTHELTVPVPGGRIGFSQLNVMREAYAKEYERIYYHPNLPYELECTNWRVFVSALDDGIKLSWPQPIEQPAVKGTRAAYVPESRTFENWPVFDRYSLNSTMRIDGPAIVEERETTTIIPIGATAECDSWQNLVIRDSGDI